VYILVRHIESVESTAYVPVAGVTVTEANRLHMGNLGHDILPGMLIECRNGVLICRVPRDLWRGDIAC